VETRSSQLSFTDRERKAALQSIDALVWKLTAAGIHLERLWDKREAFDMQQMISRVLTGNPNPRRFTDIEVTFLTTEFEAYLFQARAFISVAQIHTLDVCHVKFGGQLTNDKYAKAVSSAPEHVKVRLTKAHHYFDRKVFGDGEWSSLLKSLRDRVAHLDRCRISRFFRLDTWEALLISRFLRLSYHQRGAYFKVFETGLTLVVLS
jgi:hypothetical protein